MQSPESKKRHDPRSSENKVFNENMIGVAFDVRDTITAFARERGIGVVPYMIDVSTSAASLRWQLCHVFVCTTKPHEHKAIDSMIGRLTHSFPGSIYLDATREIEA